MEHVKRLSLAGRHDAKDRKASRERDKKSDGDRKNSPRLEPARPASLDVLVESPPLLFLGSPQSSTGCLFSGQLIVKPIEPTVVFETFEARLLLVCTSKKPVVKDCVDCATKTTELKHWTFLTEPKRYKRGDDNRTPVSCILPGHLPATTQGALVTLDYRLVAKATTSTGDSITFEKTLNVKRALYPGSDKNSTRVFPPTQLIAHFTSPPCVHPIGDFPVEMRLSGITSKQKDAQTQWRIRKLLWRIEEHQKMVSPACPKHAPKVGGTGKGILHEDTRVIGEEELKHGWKTDWDVGMIEIEFKAAINSALKPLCDVEAENGMSVKHNFVVEMVVAEEWATNKKPTQSTPTGNARILRTQFSLVVTERLGLGIAWDEEQPPMYEDVPPSPPTYKIDHYDVLGLEADLNEMHFARSPNGRT